MRKELISNILKALSKKEEDLARLSSLWEKHKKHFPEDMPDIKQLFKTFTDNQEKQFGKYSTQYLEALEIEFLFEKYLSQETEKTAPKTENALRELITKTPLASSKNPPKGFFDGKTSNDAEETATQHPDFPDDFCGDRYSGGGYDDWDKK